jgi:putative PIN family toxin of toxin-antitoxin system
MLPPLGSISLPRLKLILDTNVVLDWLVFHDASVAGLQAALNRGQVEIVTHQPAVDELLRVLAYARFKLGIEQQQELLSRYRSNTRLVTLPDGFHLDDLGLPSGFPRCRDHDDQHFLALAYHERVDGLVSKDAAVLELTRRAQKFGVTVLAPKQLAARLMVI